MGAGQSVRGLYLIEGIWPSPDGSTLFSDPAYKQKLDKEINAGWNPPPRLEPGIDENLDKVIDACIKEVWDAYDPKKLGYMDKKSSTKFFNDSLEIFAARKGVKVKELLGPGVNKGKVIQGVIDRLGSGTGNIQYKAFEAFVNEADLSEALALFTGQEGPTEVKSRLDQSKMFDPNSVKREARAAGSGAEIKFRDYNQG